MLCIKEHFLIGQKVSVTITLTSLLPTCHVWIMIYKLALSYNSYNSLLCRTSFIPKHITVNG